MSVSMKIRMKTRIAGTTAMNGIHIGIVSPYIYILRVAYIASMCNVVHKFLKKTKHRLLRHTTR